MVAVVGGGGGYLSSKEEGDKVEESTTITSTTVTSLFSALFVIPQCVEESYAETNKLMCAPPMPPTNPQPANTRPPPPLKNPPAD